MLTGGFPEVRTLLDTIDSDPLNAAATQLQLESLEIFGKDISTLWDICGASRDKFTAVLALGNLQSSSVTPEALKIAIEKAKNGEPHGLDVDGIVREFEELTAPR